MRPHDVMALGFRLRLSTPLVNHGVLGRALRAQLLKKSAYLLHLFGNKAPPSARDSSEVVILTLEMAVTVGV